ncbi:anti-sigma factor family protein [Streptomyces sp. NPDC001922]|uniref:anti-sigma factor family protein n=1 Tax=Streptomyces sp. NPDC001922 TaxID=3364624 RepID=UPI0036BB341A
MTSSTDTDQHPEVAEISALAEGLLSPDRTVDVREHLASCELCADVRTSLDEIRELLGTLPGPVRMPADVAGRIDAALAAEALLDATTPAAVSRETGVSVSAAPSVSRETEPARSHRTVDRPVGRPGGATGPGRGRRARRWRTAVFGSATALAALGLGGVVIHAIGSPGSTAKPPSATDSPGHRTTAGSFSGEKVESRVQSLLATGPKKKPSEDMGAKQGPNRTLRGSAVTVPSCVREGIGRSDAPLAATEGTYRGTEAYLVVLPDPSDTARVDAYVVDSSCAGRTPQGPGEVLLTRSVRRG